MDYLSTELCRPTLLHLEQQSPTFLAPGTCFVEDNFFHGLGGGGNSFWMIQVHYNIVLMICVCSHCLALASTPSDHQGLYPGGWGSLP